MTTATRTKITTHNKLVRDGIPAEIRAHGAFCETIALTPWAFVNALAVKLVEEANEVREVTGSSLQRLQSLEELADLQTVLNELLYAQGFSSLDLNDAVCRKMREKGRFTNRTFLIESWEEGKT